MLHGIAERQKVGKQGRDGSIKQFSSYTTSLHIGKDICRGLYTELFYAIILHKCMT